MAHIALAQAIPDTSMNQVIPDSAFAKQREVNALPNDDAGVIFRPQEQQHNAKKAGLYSALLPGAGQFYNKDYWKIPLIYAGVGVAVYFYTNNQTNYRKYRRAYILRLDNDPNNDTETIYSAAEIKTLQDEYKRWLDLTGLFTVVGYTLQILDAVAFAHLKEFDISRDISFRLQPVAHPNGGMGFGVAMHLR